MKKAKYRIDMFSDNGHGVYMTDSKELLNEFIETHDFSSCVAFLMELIDCIGKYEVIREIKGA